MSTVDACATSGVERPPLPIKAATVQRARLSFAAILTGITLMIMQAAAAESATTRVSNGHAASSATIGGGKFHSVLPTGTDRKSVKIAPFRLDRTPVTNAEFLEFVRTHEEWQRNRVVAIFADGQYLQSWSDSLVPGPATQLPQPVTSVSWFAARAYCESQGKRLPSWYEWEYAAAADELVADARRDVAWQQRILDWYSHPSGTQLSRVASQAPNLYGVYDLHGLVWEWVDDFNALMISGDDRARGDTDFLKFCGAGALALENREEYAVAMRIALLSSLQARDTTGNLGFRCASN